MRLVSINEICAELGINRMKARRLIVSQHLPTYAVKRPAGRGRPAVVHVVYDQFATALVTAKATAHARY